MNALIKTLFVLLFFCFSSPFMHAQTDCISIPLSNSAPDGIGYTESGADLWHPLFFDIDHSGKIHIPDFYKGRIAVFDKKGKLADEYQCSSALSPRMNYFGLLDSDADNPLYVCWNDSVLYVLSPESIVLEKRFSPGTVPERIIPAGELLFVILPGQKSSLIFGPFVKKNSKGNYPRVSPDPIGAYTRNKQPLFRIGSHDLAVTLDAFILLYPARKDKISAALKENGRATADFRLLGYDKSSKQAVYWIDYSAGKTGGAAWICKTLLDSDKITCKSVRFPANGFWTVVSPDGGIFRNIYDKESEAIIINKER